MRRAATLLIAAIVLSLWAGAVPAHADTDRQSRTVALPAGRTLGLEITIGTVRIEGWSRPEASIEIVRHAPSASAFARIPVEIVEEPHVRIRVLQADAGTDPALRTDVTLRVPHDAHLSAVRIMEGSLTVSELRGAITAEVRRGSIHADAVQGTVRLETSIGDVIANNARLSPGGLLRLRTFNGNVTLTLAERPADARIMALALNGTISSQIPLQMKDRWGPRWGEAMLGKGEPVISIDIVTGRIEIKVSRS